MKKIIGLFLVALSILSKAADVRVTWYPSDCAIPVTNYWVYWGVQSGKYVLKFPAGTNTSLVVSNVVVCSTNYFAVTAQADDGSESSKSEEVTSYVHLNYPPTNPSAVPVTNGNRNTR